jgi:Uma2 family endonuclease
MVLERQRVTVGEFERFIAQPDNRERRFELIHGEIVEKAMPTQTHGRIGARAVIIFGNYLDDHLLGFVEMEVRYRPEGDRYNDRLPDVSIIFDPDTPAVNKGAVERMPDIAVEVKSPDDSLTKLREKIAFYLANGTKLGLLFYPEKRLLEVYPAGEDSYTLTEDDPLEGGDLLPGFSVPVRQFFKGS